MTEFFLSVLKIVGLCLAFAMTLLQEKQHPKEQPSDSKRRITVALLILGLTVAVGAEIADLFNKHQSTAATLERHEQILLVLERSTHPLFPVGITSELSLQLGDDAKGFRERLEEAIRHHSTSYEKGTFFSLQGDPLLVRFTVESSLFPSKQEPSIKRLLEEPIGVAVRVGALPDVPSTSDGRLVIDTFQTELPTGMRLQLPQGAPAIKQINTDQYKSTVFEYHPGIRQVTAFLNEVTLRQPASSDGSIVSTKDLMGKEVNIDVASGLHSPRPSLVRLTLRFSNQQLIEMKPVLKRRATDLEVESGEGFGFDTYTFTVPKQ